MKKNIYNYSVNPDKATLRQFKNCYKQPFVVSAALMPDAHSGYVAPIGSVLITKKFVVPSWVGYDIGCGMTAIKITKKYLLNKIKENKHEIYNIINEKIPMGLGEINQKDRLTMKTKKDFLKLLNKFKKGKYNNNVLNFIENGNASRHLGSLGHGNHFIEISESKDRYAWIVVHSGSRGIGHKVAKEYMIKSADRKVDYENTFPLNEDSELGKEYLNILEFGLGFALLNRLEIIRKIIQALESFFSEKINYILWVNKNHNHAIKERGKYIHRKGATPAKKGERGVIPANMRDGSFLVSGKGSRKFLQSSSHGAGRLLSRTEAKKNISMAEYKKSMEGIQGSVYEETLDEAPSAYKDINKIMDAQKDSVKIIDQLKPIINWKGYKKRFRK